MANLAANSVNGAVSYIQPTDIKSAEKSNSGKVSELFGNKQSDKCSCEMHCGKGSFGYFKNLLGISDLMNNVNASYDKFGRVYFIAVKYNTKDGSRSGQKISGVNYIITYNDDGSFIVTECKKFKGSNHNPKKPDIFSDTTNSKYDTNGNLLESNRKILYKKDVHYVICDANQDLVSKENEISLDA